MCAATSAGEPLGEQRGVIGVSDGGRNPCAPLPPLACSLVTFLHEQESDIPPLFARRRKFPAAAGGIRNASKGCFFSCKKHPSCRCAAIHPAKIRFHGKGVPLTAASGQRRCLWNPQPLQRLAKLLHKPAAAGGNPKPHRAQRNKNGQIPCGKSGILKL